MELLLEDATTKQLKAIGARPGGTYLFTGREAIGKFTAAQELARQIAGASQPTLACRGHHPDITLVKPQKSIGIEQIHQIEQSLALKSPYPGGKKVIVIDSADKLTLPAQNAFLKTMEEPPQGATIILISAQPDRLLVTIRSRCKLIRFPAVGVTKLANYLEQETALEPPAARELATLAEGRVGLALQLAREGEFRSRFLELRALAAKLLSADLYGRLVLLQGILKDEPEQFDELAEHLLAEIRAKLQAATDEHVVRGLQPALKSTTLYLQQLEANLNRKIAANNLILNLAYA